MKLVDVRRLAIRRQLRIRFALADGLEGVIDEHGVCGVPALTRPPVFNLEEEFARAQRFMLEGGGRMETVSRPQLESMAQDKAGAGNPPEE